MTDKPTDLDKYLAEVRPYVEGGGILCLADAKRLLAIIEAQAKVVSAARECLHASDNNTGHEPSYSVWLRAEDEERKALAAHDERVKEVLDGP